MTGATGPWALLAFVSALAIAAAATPAVARWAHRLGVVAHPNPDVPTHVRVVPLLGGVAILAGITPWLAIAALSDARWIGLCAGILIVTLLGAYKDRVEAPVSPIAQLAVQSLAAGALWIGGFHLDLVSIPLLDAALTIGLVVLLVNAWNFIDIMDGLAAGVAAASAILFVGAGIASGQLGVAALGSALAGGALGYLRFNWPPARVFMGDIGSFVLGLTSAALVLATMDASQARPTVLLAVAVPLADLLFTVISRALAGRSPFRGGNEHIALRLAARGWSGRRINLAAYATAALAGAAGLLLP